MSKHLTGFLLTVCLLLAGGTGLSSENFHSHTSKSVRLASPVTGTTHGVFKTIQHSVWVRSGVWDQERGSHKAEAEEFEEKDDDLLLVFKYFGNTDFLYGPSFNYVTDFLLKSYANAFPDREHSFTALSSPLFLLIRVIRV